MERMTLGCIVGILCIFAIFCAGAASAEIILAFGVYTADKPTAIITQFRPLIKILESELTETLGEIVTIKFQISGSYEAGILALVRGEVDFSRFGPASYIEAKQANADIDILAIESNQGKKRFNGVICVAEESNIQRVEDLKNKRFAFGDEYSTIGRYLSQQYLLEHHITASDLGSYDYLQRHDKVGNAVALGKFDAGALKESTYNKLVSKGRKLRVIATFPNVTKPWVARAGLPVQIKQAMTASLLAIKDKDALESLAKDGFVAGADEDYATIRKAIKNNQDFFEH
ncbi:MAG: PhnD/SsuA/transferrin family substrate-binding protein [bacterium]|nr:PhnD/SsuA/transferrin family substrate-binding protein [bacterium]